MFKYISAATLFFCFGTTAFSSNNNKEIKLDTLNERIKVESISESKDSPRTPRNEIEGIKFDGNITLNKKIYWYKITEAMTVLIREPAKNMWENEIKKNPLGKYLLKGNNLFIVQFYDSVGNLVSGN